MNNLEQPSQKLNLMKKAILIVGLFLSPLVSAQTGTKNAAPVSTGNFAGIPDIDVLRTKLDLKDVVTKADSIPEFPGGMNAFKRKYFEHIETLDLKHNEKIDTRLYFIVEKSGYVRNVTAVSKNKKHAAAAEQGVRIIFVRWKPAKINGEAVRYLFYFPLASREYK